MLKCLFSIIFSIKKNEGFHDFVFEPIKEQKNKISVVKTSHIDDGKLLFIDCRLSENELNALYCDALNAQQNITK